jgi:hypothetical protein
VRYLSLQHGIEGTRVIIADSSDQHESVQWIGKAKREFKDHLQIETVQGGYPSRARYEGAKLVGTPTVLFLDADTMLTDPTLLGRTLEEVTERRKKLVTVTFTTDPPYNPVYTLFYVTQLACNSLLRTPFAAGGYQLWDTEEYNRLGGYDPEELFAEDYSASKRVRPKDFKIVRTGGAYTPARRFKRKGVLWMVKIMLRSYLNRNNREFFRHHHGYWE